MFPLEVSYEEALQGINDDESCDRGQPKNNWSTSTCLHQSCWMIEVQFL